MGETGEFDGHDPAECDRPGRPIASATDGRRPPRDSDIIDSDRDNCLGLELEDMSVNTILVAVGEEDRDRTDVIANVVIDVAEPTGATVAITHVIDDDTYQRALEESEEATDRLDVDAEEPEWMRRWSQAEPAAGLGIEGDIPDWVERWSQEGPATEGESLEALETVLERKDLIRYLAEAFEDAGIEYEIRGAVGDPAEHVVATSEELDADFVVVGGRDRSRARQTLFGSTSQEILRSVPCPVISVREGVDA